jgi:hypothetical protein
MKLIKLYTILSLIFTFGLLAQITIDSDEVPHEVGTAFIKNSAIDVTVALGTTGGPQTWDFTSQAMGAENGYLTIVNPATSTYIDSFPGANLVYCSPAGSDTVYQYYNLNSNYLVMLGMGAVSPSTPFLWKYDPSDSIPNPQSYGSSYNFHYGFREEITPGSELEYFHFGNVEFDAYGTVIIPYDSFACLRARVYDTCAMTMFVSSIPVYSDTITFINHQFVAEDYGAVVCVKSDTNETDPNYTDAFILERLTLFTSSIKEHAELTNLKCTHYPEIFSGYTTIQYSLPEQNHVELTLYDINGRIVKTLVNDVQASGDYSYRWYGENQSGQSLGNGIYFYRLKAGNNIHRDRVILIR